MWSVDRVYDHVLFETDAEFNAASGAESHPESDEDEVDAESEKNEPDDEPDIDEPDGDEPDAQSEAAGSDVGFDDAAFDTEPEDEGPSPFVLAFTSTGLRLAVGLSDGTVNIYNTQSKELLKTTTIEDKGVRALAYSPNNLELAIGCYDGVVVFWDPQSEEPGHTLNFGITAAHCIAYSPWKDWLAIGGQDVGIQLCRRRQLQSELSDMEASWCVIYVVEGFLDWVCDIAWNSVVRNEFVTGCLDRSVRVWRILESDDGVDGSVSVELVWGSSIGMLSAVGMRLDGVVGLDAGSLKLLRQRGAVGDFSAFEKDEADVGSDSVLGFSYGEGWDDIPNDGSLAGMDE
ncbi:hypothetical protein BGZ89_005278 [Linnemannia elongata]|nr:hypothetical protein BGZ89_005278 [Linnemannia elongata]